jgi:hypothetical protein
MNNTPQPKDEQLFALTCAITQDAMAFVEKRKASGGHIANHRDWPSLSWAEDGMPCFSFEDSGLPNYTGPFDGFAEVLAATGEGKREIYEWGKKPAFQALLDYVESEPQIHKHFFPKSDAGEDSEKPNFFKNSVEGFIRSLIEGYVHRFGFTFDRAKFLQVYLPRETFMVEDQLPIEIWVPILHLAFGFDEIELTPDVSIRRMPEDFQLARARLFRASKEISPAVVEAATHALILKDYTLPNQGYLNTLGSFLNPSNTILQIINTFFAAMRMLIEATTGYGQILVVPVGWADSYVASLPGMEGVTLRRYPPDIKGGFDRTIPTLRPQLLGIVGNLFSKILKLQEDPTGHRMQLAIRRLHNCFLREDEEDAILDATIGMELLLSDGGLEITHKLALRMAALSSTIQDYRHAPAAVFEHVKCIYALRAAVAHGDQRKANEAREIKLEDGPKISTVKLATDYLAMAVRAIAQQPEYFTPHNIDRKLLLKFPPPPEFD